MTNTDFAESLSASERRSSDRKKLIVDVHFNEGDATGIASTRDIGIGGLYMTTNAQLSIGTLLLLKVTLDGRETSISGVVVYADPGHGVGVRFHALTEENEALLKKELGI